MSIKDNYMGRVLAMLPADPSALEKSLLEAYHNPIQAELAGLNKYAILTKLQELNANKQAKANQQAQGQAQMPTVAEQILAEASPDMGGVASIPFDENLFQAASGGIVSFAEGGDVQGYGFGGQVLTEEEYNKLTPNQKVEYDRERAKVAGINTLKPFAAAADIVGGGYNLAATLADKGVGYWDRFGRMIGVLPAETANTPFVSPKVGSGSMTPYYDMVRDMENKMVVEGPQAKAEKTREEKTAEFLRKQAEQEIPYLQAQQIAEKNAAGLRAKYGNTIPAGQGKPAPIPAANEVPTMPAYGAPEFVPYEPKQLKENIYDAELANRPTFSSIADIQAQRRAERGINDDLFGQQRKDIETERAALEKQKDVNLGTFLMELGGGWQSTPGPMLSAFGASLRRATPGLIASQRDLRKEQKDLRKEDNEINRLEQARKEAMLANDTAAFEKADEKYRSYFDKKQARQDANIAAANEALKTNTTLKYDGDLKIWQTKTETEAKIRAASISANAEMRKAEATREGTNFLKTMEVNRRNREQIDEQVSKALTDQEKTDYVMLQQRLAQYGSLDSPRANRLKLYQDKERKARAQAEKDYPIIDIGSLDTISYSAEDAALINKYR